MQEVILLDGGTGRELARIGAPFRQPEWSALSLIEAPEYVTKVHSAYVKSGADVITTNSYAIVPFHIGVDRFFARGEELASLAGRLARQVADQSSTPIKVAGSLPPLCGSYRADLFKSEEARPILEILVRGLRPYVDHWQAETLSTIEEAELVRDVIGPDEKPLWISFTLKDDDVSTDQPELRSGQSVNDAVYAALKLNVSAILFNCSQPEVMGSAIRVARELLISHDSEIRIGVYANAFPPQSKDAEANSGLDDIRTDLNPEGYLKWAHEWVELGTSIIGGCCGIGPEHIQLLHDRIVDKKSISCRSPSE